MSSFKGALKIELRLYDTVSTGLEVSRKEPSPPFRGEREGPAQREGEVGSAANRPGGPPHPALSPGRRGERIT